MNYTYVKANTMPPIKVTLANKYEPTIKNRKKVNGWLLFIKMDGVRVYYSHKDKKFYSRAGKEYVLPKEITGKLPEGHDFDGELYAGPGTFHLVSGYARTIEKSTKAVPKDLKFYIFDRPDIKGTYMERMPPGLDFKNDFLVQAPYTIINPETNLEKILEEAIEQGEEGLILRNNLAEYEYKRTSSLLKYTARYQDEAIVTGYELGTGRLEGIMGALNVVSTGKNKTAFKIGTGFTDEQRQNNDELFPIGTVVTFSYKSFDEDSGAPREPAFVTVRDYE